MSKKNVVTLVSSPDAKLWWPLACNVVTQTTLKVLVLPFQRQTAALHFEAFRTGTARSWAQTPPGLLGLVVRKRDARTCLTHSLSLAHRHAGAHSRHVFLALLVPHFLIVVLREGAGCGQEFQEVKL